MAAVRRIRAALLYPAFGVLIGLAGCVQGPPLVVMPGPHKSYDAFRQDDASCRAAMAPPAAPAPDPNLAYAQCMAARGNTLAAPPPVPASPTVVYGGVYPGYYGGYAYPYYGDPFLGGPFPGDPFFAEPFFGGVGIGWGGGYGYGWGGGYGWHGGGGGRYGGGGYRPGGFGRGGPGPGGFGRDGGGSGPSPLGRVGPGAGLFHR